MGRRIHGRPSLSSRPIEDTFGSIDLSCGPHGQTALEYVLVYGLGSVMILFRLPLVMMSLLLLGFSSFALALVRVPT